MASSLGIRAHSTRSVAFSKVFTKFAPLHPASSAASWSYRYTFIRGFTVWTRIKPQNLKSFQVNPFCMP